MGTNKMMSFVVAFFCLCGWVCNAQVIGAENTDNTGQASQVNSEKSDVNVTRFDTVQLNVQNTDLNNVLQLLSVQGKRNIVPSPKVQGTVTANLYDVTFYEAMDAILQQNGCGYLEKGNFIYIYTLDELQKIKEAERKVTHRLFRLNYITATDASTFVTPLLSSAGSIAISGAVGSGFQPSISDGGANSYAHIDTMIVRDYPKNIDAIVDIIKQLDIKPMQVLVEATILKADVTEEAAFGIDLSIIGHEAISAFTNPLSAVTDMITGTVQPKRASAVTSSVGNVTGGKGGLQVGIVTNNVAGFIRALDSVTDTTILANPKLMVLNRQKGDVLIGEKIGYLSTTSTSTATTQTVEFLDTGTQLTFRPFISKEGDNYIVRMELRPQVSEARIRNVIPGTSTAAVTIPDEITQELTTNVMVRDGQTIVLGGLFKEKTTITRDQVPVVGDIPILGNAFKGKDDTIERNEVIFLITPHVVRDQALYAAGESVKDSIEMKRLGVRAGLLPWARSKMTAGHLREALIYLDADDKDRALWEVDMALSLDPQRLEAIRLKEKLSGQREYMPNDSILDKAVDQMVEQQTGKRSGSQRTRPMIPSPRKSEPVSDEEPLIGTLQSQPTQAQTAPQTQSLTDATPTSEELSDEDHLAVDMPSVDQIQTLEELTQWQESQVTSVDSATPSNEEIEPSQSDQASTLVAAPQEQTNGSSPIIEKVTDSFRKFFGTEQNNTAKEDQRQAAVTEETE